MAEKEKDEPNFDDFELPEDVTSPERVETSDFTGIEPAPKTEELTEPVEALAPVETEELSEPAEMAETPESAEPQEIEVAPKPQRASGMKKLLERLPADRGLLGIVGAAVMFAFLWVFGAMYLSTALLLMAVGAVLYVLWKGRTANSLFTAMLGFALIAMLVAIYCLWMEWGHYGFERKAHEVRAGVSATVVTDETLV